MPIRQVRRSNQKISYSMGQESLEILPATAEYFKGFFPG